jgi:hypothetical protein
MVAKDKPTPDARTTEILFGQFPGLEAPSEIPSDRKMLYLDHYAKSHGGLLAGKNRQLDLRYDDLHISND